MPVLELAAPLPLLTRTGYTMGIGRDPEHFTTALTAMNTATLTARQTPKTCKGGTRQVACDWSSAMIPAEWIKAGTLGRPCGCKELETDSFYKLPDGRVARITYHPMNGPDDLFVAIGTAEEMRSDWTELLAGEPWEERNYHGYGMMSTRRGRYVKARRID